MIFASSGPLGEPLGGHFGRLGGLLDRLGAILGRLWASRTVLRRLGALLGRVGAVLEPSWPVLGASWAVLDASEAVLEGGGGHYHPFLPPSPPSALPLKGFAHYSTSLTRTSLFPSPGPARKRKERLRNLPEMAHGTLRSREPWW